MARAQGLLGAGDVQSCGCISVGKSLEEEHAGPMQTCPCSHAAVKDTRASCRCNTGCIPEIGALPVGFSPCWRLARPSRGDRMRTPRLPQPPPSTVTTPDGLIRRYHIISKLGLGVLW